MQGWWCFKVDVKKKPELPKATQKLEVSSSSQFLVEDAMWPMEMDMELKMRDLSLSCAMYSLQIPKSGFGLHHP